MKYPEDYINKVHCANCIEFMKGIPDNSIDFVATDPPYEVNKADWDKEPKGWINEVYRILKQGGAFYCFYSSLKIGKMQVRIEKHFKLLNICIWYATNQMPMLKARDRFSLRWQPIFYAIKGEKPNYNVYNFSRYGAQSTCNVWAYSCPQSNYNGLNKRVHLTQKPIELMTRIIRASSKEKDIILDPFCGSGTTLIACKQLNRYFIGIDIKKEHKAMADKRLMAIPENLPFE